MKDSLLEDDRLTTADIARPATPRQARAEANREAERVDGEAAVDSRPIPLPAATNTPATTGNPSLTDAGQLFSKESPKVDGIVIVGGLIGEKQPGLYQRHMIPCYAARETLKPSFR